MAKLLLWVLLVTCVMTCVVAKKMKKNQKPGQNMWKKKQAAVAARTDFNNLWDRSLEDDQRIMEEGRATRRGGGKGPGMGLTAMFTDDTKTERLLLFNNARSRIETLESQRPDGRFKLKENFFALMTESEKSGYLGINITLSEEKVRQLPSGASARGLLGASSDKKPPPPRHSLLDRSSDSDDERSKRSTETLDWRDYGAVTPVKNQGSCGSCWSFGSIAALEGAYFLATGNAKNFSEQQQVDCNADYGCKGGWWPTVWDDIKTNKYVSLEEDVAYEGSKVADDCSRTTTNGLEDATLTGYEIMRTADGEDTMLENLQSYGPIAICIYVDDSVYYYESGYIDSCIGEDCNHLVTLVGYEADSLIIKNSWGTSWGLDGYLKVQRGCASDGYSYWASFPYVVADESSSDDTAEEEEEGEESSAVNYIEVGSHTDLVLKKDYDVEALQTGDCFVLKGSDVGSSSKKWFLNLLSVKDKAYHIEFQRSKSRYVVNYKKNGQWGSKKSRNFPESIGEDDEFELKLTVTDSSFDASINNETLISFDHVVDVDSIDAVEIGGAAATFVSITQYRLDTASASNGAEEEEYSGPCFDYQFHCVYWKENGYCKDEGYTTWMTANCPKSCSLC